MYLNFFLSIFKKPKQLKVRVFGKVESNDAKLTAIISKIENCYKLCCVGKFRFHYLS